MKVRILSIALLSGALCWLTSIALSQIDSLRLRQIQEKLKDTTIVGRDSLSLFTTKNSTDTLVAYIAKDSVVYRIGEKRMHLFGGANIDYGESHLQSERITINWESSTLLSQGIPDTTKGREGKFIGTPKFKEGNEEYVGQEMSFNFKTKKGLINYGETKIDNGFYLGEKIRRMSDEVYFIQDGKYTTCDDPIHKHYYFGSPKMKFVPKDVVIAEPIVLFIEDVPVFALPFAVIPSKGGRQSGIIPPTYGEFGARGRYLKGGGYYWAMSDYTDVALTADWYSKGGYQLNASLQYNLRYNFSGSIRASYGRQRFEIGNPYAPDDEPSTDYNLSLNHNQEINPSSRLAVNFSFLTNSYYRRLSTNLEQLLQQNVTSRATYSTLWEGTNRSLTVNVSRDQNLNTGTSTNVLPDISFNQSQIFPFKRKGSTGDEAWYEMIGFNYNGSFKNNLNITKRKLIDSTELTETFDRRGAQHNVSLIATPKAGYLTISPSFSYSERWYDHQFEKYYDPSDTVNKIKLRDVKKFSAIRTFNLGVSLSTKLYGILQPNVFGLQGIRHTITPVVSYSFNPDFSKDSWGYYKSYRDSLNNLIRYDPYTGDALRPGEIFGGVPTGESQSISMSVGNNFEMKLKPAVDDTTQTPRRFQFLNLNLSTSYNFVADSFTLAPLSVSYRTNIGELLDITGNSTFSPYVFEGKREVNKYLINERQGLLRLTSFGFSLTSSLSSQKFASKSVKEYTTEAKRSEFQKSNQAYTFSLPWSLSFGYDFSQSQFNPNEKSRQSSVRASLSFTLGDVWRISSSGYYDIVNRQLSAPSISVSRDLHCWEMNFNWTPTGQWTQFNFIIRLKASQLQDIKLEKKGSARGVF